MSFDREELLERVLNAYSRWYDIEPQGEDRRPLAAIAEFHEHGTGYVLIKSAQTYSADRHEYAYFYSVPVLTREVYDRLLAQTMELGEPMVKPDEPGHMCTNLVMAVLCDTAQPDALEALKSCRIRKSFQYSLKGWMEVQTVAIEVGKAAVTANGAARNTVKFLESVLHPKQGRKTNILSKLFGRKRSKHE